MIKTLSFDDFAGAFESSETYKNKFTREGLIALFDYMEELEESLGEQVEFDMVCIACDYSEYKTAWEAMEQYQPEDMPVIDMEKHAGIDLVELQALQEAEANEWLLDKTEVIGFQGGIIIRDF